MKTQSIALVARILVKTPPIRTTGEKALWKHGALCVSSEQQCKNRGYSHDRWKGTVETQGIASIVRSIVKTEAIRTTGEKALWKHAELHMQQESM